MYIWAKLHLFVLLLYEFDYRKWVRILKKLGKLIQNLGKLIPNLGILTQNLRKLIQNLSKLIQNLRKLIQNSDKSVKNSRNYLVPFLRRLQGLGMTWLLSMWREKLDWSDMISDKCFRLSPSIFILNREKFWNFISTIIIL